MAMALMTKAYPYEGECRLLRWGDSSTAGRTITLEIPPDTGDVHPFKGFPVGTKFGQRFRMRFDVILDDETTPTATDSVEAPARTKEEIIPTGWTEGEGFHPMERPPRAKEKDSDKSERAKAQYASLDEMEQARTRAVLLCKDEHFWNWIWRAHPGGWAAAIDATENNEEAAAHWLCEWLEIKSRREIATNNRAFHGFLQTETTYKQAVGQLAEIRS